MRSWRRMAACTCIDSSYVNHAHTTLRARDSFGSRVLDSPRLPMELRTAGLWTRTQSARRPTTRTR
eukprot:scaffold1167_cov418-Prasinococcus_capsulatus_cf.AAC.28